MLSLKSFLVAFFAKQKNSFICWLKPIAKDKFESMTFFGENVSFKRNRDGEIVSLSASFPRKTHYQERFTGQWVKTLGNGMKNATLARN